MEKFYAISIYDEMRKSFWIGFENFHAASLVKFDARCVVSTQRVQLAKIYHEDFYETV